VFVSNEVLSAVEKRYQVFVSSTFSDLQEERQAVMQALLSLDHFPAGMELFPASDDDQWALIRGVIDDSDYYVLVTGGRYGSTSSTGISYTEMEYDYAVAKKKPILAFVHGQPGQIPAGKTDQSDKLRAQLEAFIKKVESNKHVKFWKNPDELKAQVIQSISAETKRNPQEGWIRANRASDPVVLERMRQEIDRLNRDLLAVKTDPPNDVQQYSQGAEKFTVELTYETEKKSDIDETADVSWNYIFFEAGPLLLEEASEAQLKRRFAEELWRYDYDKFPGDFKRVTRISNDSFDTIKIQLLALGLIHKSQKKHVPSDTNRYWSLTPYGETALMKLRAIKRQPSVAKTQSK
jgi:hypothetical protein